MNEGVGDVKISADEIRNIAKMAKLRFSDEEIQKLAREFESILSHFRPIDKIDLENVDLKEFLNNRESVTRQDETMSFDDKKKLFQNAKSIRESYIRVPKIIE